MRKDLISINLYQSLSISINLYQSLSISINLYQSLSISINLYQSLSISINRKSHTLKFLYQRFFHIFLDITLDLLQIQGKIK